MKLFFSFLISFYHRLIFITLPSFPSSPHNRCISFVTELKTHQDRAPTRHNLLCDGKSVWEVIRKHPDLEKNKLVSLG